MCGLSGYFDTNLKRKIDNSEEILLSMLETQKHRGPDFNDFKIYENCGLAHNRLDY